MTSGFGDGSKRVPTWVAAAAFCGLLALAAAFSTNVIGGVPRKDDIPEVQARYSDPAMVRKVRAEMTFDGAPCQSCHDGKEPMQGNPREKGVFHEAIKLQHGRNQHCFNCHHRLRPANFANFDGSPIALSKIELLCSRCHGTIYRDWKQGIHGRRTGYWDATKGAQKYTACIACHEPHWPVFKLLTAAPEPRVNPRGPSGEEH